jgi:hypothetical protein
MADRHNFFTFPHKPFRHMWMDVVAAVGRTNPTLEKDLEALDTKVAFACDVYAHHNRDESEWFATRVRELDSALATRWLRDHDSHLEVLTKLTARVHAIRGNPSVEARTKELADLYRYVCHFLAEDLVHMEFEQTEIMSSFQKAYTDEQLRAMEQQFIQERIDPAFMQSLTPLFLQAGNVDDRTFLLTMAKQKMPPPAFNQMLSGLVANIVAPEELSQLKTRLGVSA